MDKVRISVVIPTYNRESLIARAIDSALGQTYPACEIIVVDDGSKDNTASVVASYGDRVTYVPQTNSGASVSRNKGVAVAREEWIAFLDSDDTWEQTHLERMARAINGTGGKALFYFADMERPLNHGIGSHWSNCGFNMTGEYMLSEDASDWVMIPWQPMMLQSSVIQRAAFLGCGGLMPAIRIRHDTHFFLKLGLGGPACAVAGYGTRQTYDGGDHLMASASRSVHFANDTVILYRDLLQQFPSAERRYRREMRTRLCRAEWALAKGALRKGRVPECVSRLAHCVYHKGRSFISP